MLWAAATTATAAYAAISTTNAGANAVQPPTTTDNTNMEIDVSDEMEYFEIRIDTETFEDLLFDLENRTVNV